MKLKIIVIAGFAAAIIIGLAVFKSSDSAVAAEGQGGAPAAPVSVITVTEQPAVFTKDLPGRVSAVRIAEIRPQVSGIVLKRLYTEGSNVKAGQQLYQIDPALFEAALESAKAQLLKAEANLIATAPKAERYAELVKDGGVSKQEYDEATSDYVQAKAAVAVAKAAVKTAEINLTYTMVLSPISGHIGKSNVTEGALVTANQSNALALVQQLDKVNVDVKQSAEDIFKLRKMLTEGDSKDSSTVAQLFVNGAEYAYKGTIEFSDVTVDETTGMVQIRAVFPNPDGELLPGLFVKARVAQAKDAAALLIPQQTVVRQANGSSVVWVVDADNTVNPRPVVLGDAVGNKWLVLSGLKAGEKIVFQGFQKIRPGSKVAVTEQKAE